MSAALSTVAPFYSNVRICNSAHSASLKINRSPANESQDFESCRSVDLSVLPVNATLSSRSRPSAYYPDDLLK
jgi:hypothetical protein